MTIGKEIVFKNVIPADAGLNSIGLNLNSFTLARRAGNMDVSCNPVF
jgi:hypothetical protein